MTEKYYQFHIVWNYVIYTIWKIGQDLRTVSDGVLRLIVVVVVKYYPKACGTF